MDHLPFYFEILVFGHFWCKWQVGDALYLPSLGSVWSLSGKEGIELSQQFWRSVEWKLFFPANNGTYRKKNMLHDHFGEKDLFCSFHYEHS